MGWVGRKSKGEGVRGKLVGVEAGMGWGVGWGGGRG